jgi:hypothetical protein
VSSPSPRGLWSQIRAQARRACDRPGLDWRIKEWKFVARAWLTPGLTRRWYADLARPGLAPLAAARPRVYAKLQRPYLASSFGPSRRLELVEAHYDFTAARIPPAALAAICAPAGLTLCELSFESTGPVSLRFLYTDKYEKEGELTLGIYAQEPARLVTAASFTVGRGADGRPEFLVGGLQANNVADQRDLIRDVTKEMLGLRPKAFALWAVQTVAAAWDVPAIRGVGDSQHVYRHFQKRRELAASYDEFWKESDGKEDGAGFFVLPPRFEPRPMEDIKANKRSQYRKRYELLESLGGKLREGLERARLLA